MRVSVRIATPADLPSLLQLMRGYYRDDGLLFELDGAAAVMSRLLAEPQWGFVLVLDTPGSLIGYVAVCIGFSLELGGNDAFIDEVFVASEHRRCGYGRRLLEAAASQATLIGVRALHLEVDRGNAAARALYASLGFTVRDRYFLMTRSLS
jgi:ribosomal protein S18 acetylase RimI-like enzyme